MVSDIKKPTEFQQSKWMHFVASVDNTIKSMSPLAPKSFQQYFLPEGLQFIKQ